MCARNLNMYAHFTRDRVIMIYLTILNLSVMRQVTLARILEAD